MPRLVWWVVMVLLTVFAAGLLWGSALPLGIPGEWTWPRLPADAQSGWNLLLAGIAACGYAAFVGCGGRRLVRPSLPALEVSGWLGALVFVSGGWLWVVQETAPLAGQWAKAPFVLYYPSSSGYFFRVRYEAQSARQFLAEYEDLMAEGDVLHIGTHPPGLFLVFFGLTALQDAQPSVADWLAQLQPESFREAMATIRENTATTAHPAEPRDGITLWLATLLVWACGALTVLPLYGLFRFNLSRDAAWLGAALWPTLPALAIFLPKSDAAYPFLSTSLVFAVVGSWRRRSWLGAFAAGLILWCGLMCSLAFLPVVLFCGLYVAADRCRGGLRPLLPPRDVIWAISGVAGFVIPIVIFWWQADANLPAIWWWNYRNHAGFYGEYVRTWWYWLLVNPLELAVAVGIPVMLLAGRSLVSLRRGLPAVSGQHLAAGLGLIVWGLLWISGKNSGEAARLWLLLMPGVVWLAAQGLEGRPAKSRNGSVDLRFALGVLTLQLVAAILTVHRVGGFHLGTP